MNELELLTDGQGRGLELRFKGRRIIAQDSGLPFLKAGSGRGRYEMNRGNFKITEELEALEPLDECTVLSEGASGLVLRFFHGADLAVDAAFAVEGGRLVAGFSPARGEPNRLVVSLPAEPSEHIYGCGEQFSFLDLRGRDFPLWTSEQGVGRNKATRITRLADEDGGSGGDYYWTFFPQTSFVSSSGYWCHLDTSAYADFDFRAKDRHELYSWAMPKRLVIGMGDTMRATVSDLSDYFGRQGRLPDWCYEGAILGVQGGTAVCLEKLAAAEAAGVKVAGLWAQDWEGINVTSFGQRLRWNWVWDAERYPGLDREIAALRARGIRFLGYINPYVGAGMSLFREAAAMGYLAKDASGGDYLVEFGEFYAGIVDLTNPEAFGWYKSVIKKNLIAFGLSGWMADFGEYLPTDAALHSGESAEMAHNEWPALWARCNREAVDEAEAEGLVRPGEILYFMRAGGVGSQRCCPLMWAGDQNVDWSEDDGLPSVITAALSLGFSGHGLHHSDLGGYTTLYGMRRTKELFMRWAELSALSVLMRGHEGNRPKENWQFDSDSETLAHLARMTAFHAALRPYLEAAVAENAQEGIPVMRPLFLSFEEDEKAWTIKDEYLLGPDLLVAPVITEGAVARRVHLPTGSWKQLWSGKVYPGGDLEIAAPLGEPPVFARSDSRWMEVFERAVSAALAIGDRP
jgi:alpha-glucosidase